MKKPSLYLQLYGGLSRAQRVAINTIFVLVFLVFYGLWKDFIVSDHWRALGFNLTCVITAAITVFLYSGVFMGKFRGSQHQSALKNIIGFLALPILVYF